MLDSFLGEKLYDQLSLKKDWFPTKCESNHMALHEGNIYATLSKCVCAENVPGLMTNGMFRTH